MKNLFIIIFIVLSCNLFGQESMINSKSIDTTQFVNIGGIKQFISIKGKKNKPLLLYLHGGPGAVDNAAEDISTDFIGAQDMS